MIFGRLSALIVALLSLGVATIPVAYALDDSKIPSLDDYPPAITRYLLAEFDVQRKVLEARGIPASEEELADWNACENSDENAHTRYIAAFAADVRSEQLRLLAEAAAIPCYQYRAPEQSWWQRFWNGTPVDVDFSSDMRETSRVIANEIVIQTALGEVELAVQHAEMGLGLLGHVAKAPVNLIQLSRYACQGLILNAFQDMLSSATFSDAQLARLDLALVQAHDPAVLARTWAAERLIYETDDPFAWTPTVHVIDARSRAEILAARGAVAIERYRLAHGSLPETLAELVPAYLPEAPIDPFNGAPMHYVAGTHEYAVFSVDGDGEPCANPLETTRGEERTLVRIATDKTARPLSEMFYAPENSGKNSTRAEIEAIKQVASVVLKAIKRDTGTIMLSAGSLENGRAVLFDAQTSGGDGRVVPVLAAFWVKEGVIHTVNTWARDLAPDLPRAPEAITFDRVRDVVH